MTDFVVQKDYNPSFVHYDDDDDDDDDDTDDDDDDDDDVNVYQLCM